MKPMPPMVLVQMLWAVIAPATEAYMQGRAFACADYTQGKVFIIQADGTIARQYPAPRCDDLWILPSGHLLFTTGWGAREITPEGQTVFQYTTKSEVYACQRLANGNTFVGECGSGRLLEVTPTGSVAVNIPLLPKGATTGGHLFMRNARKLPNGHYLVAHYGEERVCEYDAVGEKVWESPAPGGPHSLCRLPNGNTLIATGDRSGRQRLIEVDRDAQTVWELTNNDLEGAPLRFCAGFQRLPNGNTLISNWLGHGQFGQAPHLLEITPAKKIVWTYSRHKDIRTIAAVCVFDINGQPLPGEPLR